VNKLTIRARARKMSEAEDKAERNIEAVRQEQEEVRRLKDAGHVAYRIAREIDTLAVDGRDGCIYLCDCKHTENGENVFYIEESDIAKGLDERQKWLKCFRHLKEPPKIIFRVEVFFRRHRSHNRRYVYLDENDRGWSIRVTRGEQRFSLLRVKRGNGNSEKIQDGGNDEDS
jgi:hypothetical protein